MKKIQLSIPEPCHENWEVMSPTQQGRFCNACAKEVIDFSNMSDSEVLNYFIKKKKEDNVCGRAFPDQLGRNIYAAAQKKKYWQWQYILTAFLFFMKPAKTKAQGAVLYIAADTTYSVTTVKEKKHKKITVSGTVKDEEGKPVPYASVKVKDGLSGVSADENGRFSLKIKKTQSIEVSALSYEMKEVILNDGEKIEVVLKKDEQLLKEVVVNSTTYGGKMRCVVSGGISVRSRISYRTILKDTVNNLFNNFKPSIKIYPNPVLKGNSFTVSMKLKQTGNLSIQITDAAGRLITEKKINTASKEWNEQVATGATWSGGVYYVRILNEEKSVVTTGSLIVQ